MIFKPQWQFFAGDLHAALDGIFYHFSFSDYITNTITRQDQFTGDICVWKRKLPADSRTVLRPPMCQRNKLGAYTEVR